MRMLLLLLNILDIQACPLTPFDQWWIASNLAVRGRNVRTEMGGPNRLEHAVSMPLVHKSTYERSFLLVVCVLKMMPKTLELVWN
jgi:hypothetical protein